MRRILSFLLAPMKASLLLALACSLMPAAMHADTTNLLANPGAETGSLSGWTVTFGAPGVDTFDPSITPHSGSHDFSGDSASLAQTVSVFTQGITAAMVNTGTLSAQFSFWEQGVNDGTSSGAGAVFLNFLDGATSLETASETVDSHNGVWKESVGTTPIPIGTTAIEYNMVFATDSTMVGPTFIDDNSLIILAPAGTGPTPPPVPEPGTLALFGTGLVGLAGVARRKLTD